MICHFTDYEWWPQKDKNNNENKETEMILILVYYNIEAKILVWNFSLSFSYVWKFSSTWLVPKDRNMRWWDACITLWLHLHLNKTSCKLVKCTENSKWQTELQT